jgi:hypothetical protein
MLDVWSELPPPSVISMLSVSDVFQESEIMPPLGTFIICEAVNAFTVGVGRKVMLAVNVVEPAALVAVKV